MEETFLKDCFKEPGEYAFDESTRGWNKLAQTFDKEKLYTHAPEGSVDYWKFWDNEELKCRLGIIWKHNNKIWYLTTKLRKFFKLKIISNRYSNRRSLLFSFFY